MIVAMTSLLPIFTEVMFILIFSLNLPNKSYTNSYTNNINDRKLIQNLPIKGLFFPT